jgi:hypothetical protein
MALTTELTLKLVATLTGSGDLLTPSAPLELTQRHRLTSGTGLDAADMMWSDRRTLAASATEDLDLAASLSPHVGTGTLTFARIKALVVLASSANTNDVQVTRPASNGVPVFLAAGDGLPVKPGGSFVWVAPNAAGVAVTAATGDLITFTNSAGSTSVTYDVVIIGASA